jgi:hypothetical protein
MRVKRGFVTALTRLYPRVWRHEYGPELTEMLLARPLDAAIVADVLMNGLRERVRRVEPSTVFGSILMLLIVTGFVWNVVAPQPYRNTWIILLQPSLKTMPTVTVRPLASELYALLLVGCGIWTHLRHVGQLSQSGIAAMKICLIAGMPIMLAGVLMFVGVLGVIVMVPGDMSTAFREHGIAFTYYSAQGTPPTSLSVLVSPLFRLPESWIWGIVGGWLGRRISRLRHSRRYGSGVLTEATPGTNGTRVGQSMSS